MRNVMKKNGFLPARHKPRETKAPTGVYVFCYLLAAALIALGVLNGGLRDVLVKAVRICTECIGLG